MVGPRKVRTSGGRHLRWCNLDPAAAPAGSDQDPICRQRWANRLGATVSRVDQRVHDHFPARRLPWTVQRSHAEHVGLWQRVGLLFYVVSSKHGTGRVS